jgi:hypothetical protein
MLLRAALVNDDKDDDPSIVGFWHFKFLVGKSVFDGGYSQWHSDGTEITNSGSIPPWSSNFCLGVWKKVGVRKYELNHFAVSWDPTNLQATMPMGPANIRETVTMSPDGNEFSGTFSIVQYDNADNVLQQVQGTVTATRINVDTKASSIF